MKLTWTDAVFSRAACMVFLCAGIWISKYLRKFLEKSQKIHAPEVVLGHKWGQRGPRRPAGAATPWLCREAAWGGPTPFGALPSPLFLPIAEKPQNRSLFPIYVAEPPPPSVLFWSFLAKGKNRAKVGHQGVWDPPRRVPDATRGWAAPHTLLGAPWLLCGPPLASWNLRER